MTVPLRLPKNKAALRLHLSKMHALDYDTKSGPKLSAMEGDHADLHRDGHAPGHRHEWEDGSWR